MQIEATTSQAAFTGSPRVSATIAKEIAPIAATAAHINFARNVTVPLLPRIKASNEFCFNRPSRRSYRADCAAFCIFAIEAQ